MLPELSKPINKLGGGLTLRNAGTSHWFKADAENGLSMQMQTNKQTTKRISVFMTEAFLIYKDCALQPIQAGFMDTCSKWSEEEFLIASLSR
jgi:hypothetical protein